MSANNSTPGPSRSSGFSLPGMSDMVDERDKKPIPKWVPVSLLTLTTVALAVPIVLLRRQWSSTVARSVKGAPPPPRRVVTGPLSSTARPSQPVSKASAPVPPPRMKTSPAPTKPVTVNPDDRFNGAFYSVKAFGIATAMVTVGAVTTVWGVKLAMGVQDTKEFADRMRNLILTRMPILSSRIHRPPAPQDNPVDWTPELKSSSPLSGSDQNEELEWSWPSAEKRLGNAFQERGFYGWFEAVLHELEAEGQAERRKRGHA
ncbi:hypothetical protein BXZ70DRAFT_1041920 [Cristinia sonorae]|uniref:Uncharacterized protein n=1 Tax=Cristinia sonorae TaxID=1940300 RepID=A0A8K0UIT9_9AGAR|nr:hypothetical protein BXZ70DRAFT_1041920 [Cristinia sonorae]